LGIDLQKLGVSPGRAIAVAVVCALGLACAPGASGPGPSDGGKVLRLDEGRFLRSDSERPPPAGAAGWEPVVLPDRWAQSRPGERGTGWYRFEIPELPQTSLLGLYLPRLDMNVSVWMDGELLGQCGRFAEPMARCWNRPFYVPLGRLERRPRTLAVRLDTGLTHGGLAPLLLGPHETLLPRYLRDRFLRLGVVRHFSGMAVLVAALMLVFWAGSRDSVYGYFALLITLWGGSALDSHVRDVPVSHAVWEWATHACVDWMAVVGVLVSHRLARLERPRVERAVIAAMALATAISALVPPERLHDVVGAVHGFAIGLGLYAGWVMFRGARDNARGRNIAVVAITGAVAIGLHDLLILNGFLPMDQPRLMVLVAPLLTFSFAILLGFRFVQQLERTRNLNLDLEESVREKEEELIANFRRVRELERERAVASERARIMREVHDGMGAQLVSALAMVESGESSETEVSDALRSSIDDMRLVVDSLDPDVDDLPMLLGMIRGRSETRLRRRGLRFDWRVTDLPRIDRFGPPQYLNVLRIFQEALTNVLKHAGARVVSVTTGLWQPGGVAAGVFVELRDDGCGIDPDATSGRGLRNMVRRAWDVGGELRIEDAEPGTRVTLVIPFEPPPEGDPPPASQGRSRPEGPREGSGPTREAPAARITPDSRGPGAGAGTPRACGRARAAARRGRGSVRRRARGGRPRRRGGRR